MSNRKITVTVGSLEEMGKEFIDVWHQVELGKKIKGAPIEKVVFEDERLLFKTLTPKRCELLKYVHEKGKISIRALARQLHRDYSNVYQDVKALNHVGLMPKDEKDEKYYVPWKTITTEIPLCVGKSPKHSHYNYGLVEHATHG
jgi:predicted transcriptional regulator